MKRERLLIDLTVLCQDDSTTFQDIRSAAAVTLIGTILEPTEAVVETINQIYDMTRRP